MIIPEIRRPWQKSTPSQGARNNDRSFYTTKAWRITRAAFLQAHPYCANCGDKAQMVDHKKRILDQGAKHDWNNLQSMCNSCHASKSARESNESRKR